MELWEAEDENLGWPVLREFGSGIRELLKKRKSDG
jgi:phage-related protein